MAGGLFPISIESTRTNLNLLLSWRLAHGRACFFHLWSSSGWLSVAPVFATTGTSDTRRPHIRNHPNGQTYIATHIPKSHLELGSSKVATEIELRGTSDTFHGLGSVRLNQRAKSEGQNQFRLQWVHKQTPSVHSSVDSMDAIGREWG